MMTRRSLLVRCSAVACAAALAAGSIGSVSAAGRYVYFGSPTDAYPPGANGTIGISQPLVANQLTAFVLLLTNTGTSTLTQVAISGGSSVTTTTGAPAQPYLTPGASFVALLPVGSGTCSLTTTLAANDGFTCTFPNLPSGASASVQVAVRAQSDATQELRVVAAATVKENRNDSGANPDTFYALGTAPVLADNLDSISTFLGPNAPDDVFTPAGTTDTNHQRTTTSVPGAPNGQPVGISEVHDPNNAYCASGYSCFGDAAIASVNYGNLVTPYLEWRMDWDVSVLPKSYNEKKGGVIHLLDNGTFVVIPVKTACSTRVTTNCVVSYGYSADGLTYSIVFRTPTNGSTRGF
jgi:hypothetical protein